MKILIKRLLKFLGYDTDQRNHGYDYEGDAEKAIALVQQNTMVAFEPLVTLFQQVRHCEVNDIEGAFVECGVWKGGAVGLMALTNNQFGQTRRHLHLFDVFDDICEPDPLVDGAYAIDQVAALAGVEKESLQGRLRPVKGVYDSHGGHGTLEIVRQLLENEIGYNKEYLHYYEGWFQETLPLHKDQIDKIAVLRLDADLYASTKICLEFLYDKVVAGGFVIIDDYGAYEGCRKAVDEFRAERQITSFMIHVNQDCRFWIKD
jgi:hypothetical protein